MKAQINTERLTLRNFRMENATSMFKSYCSNENITKYLSWYSHRSVSDTQDYLRNFKISTIDDGLIDLAITLKENEDVVIGSIGFVKMENGVGEVGYVISEKYWNKGFMSEALKGFIDHAFKVLPIHRITAIHVVGNTGSGRVMEKCGMKFVEMCSTKRKFDSPEDDLVDCRRYEILNGLDQ